MIDTAARALAADALAVIAILLSAIAVVVSLFNDRQIKAIKDEVAPERKGNIHDE